MRIIMGSPGYRCSHQFLNVSFNSVKLQPNFFNINVEDRSEADLVFRTHFDVYPDRNLPHVKQSLIDEGMTENEIQGMTFDFFVRNFKVGYNRLSKYKENKKIVAQYKPLVQPSLKGKA